MVNLIFLIIFFISLAMIAMTVLKKIPILLLLPSEEFKKQSLLNRFRQKDKMKGLIKIISSKEILLHRALSRFRVLTMKTEKKTGSLLSSLRQKSIEKQEKKDFQKDYWQDLRNKR